MKSEVKFKVRSLNLAQPVGKFTSDFIRAKKICCHIMIITHAIAKKENPVAIIRKWYGHRRGMSAVDMRNV